MSFDRRRVVTIDCQYRFSQYAAAYLLIDGDEAAFIDNNTAHSVPLLLEALKREGLTPSQVKWIIITHVHLDHAGGTSRLAEACAQAQCLAHPRAARHLIDPSRLVASARQVYGDEPFTKMYGRIDPIPAARVRSIADGESVAFGQRSDAAPLRFFHTRGHANHHMCIHDPESGSVFTGDSFGLVYPVLQRAGLFAFPSTSPTDFDYDEALASLDKIVATQARIAYPTHFGGLTNLAETAAQLRAHLDFSQDLMTRAADLADRELEPYFEAQLTAYFKFAAEKVGLKLTAADLNWVHMDLVLNAQGLAHAMRKARNPSP